MSSLVTNPAFVVQSGFVLATAAAVCLSWTVGLFITVNLLGYSYSDITKLHYEALSSYRNFPVYLWNLCAPAIGHIIGLLFTVSVAPVRLLEDAAASGNWVPGVCVLTCASLIFAALIVPILTARNKGMSTYQDNHKKQN